MLLDGNRYQWIGHAGREVELILDELGQIEMERVLAVAQVGDRLGIGSEPSFAAVAEAAPQPWQIVLEGHRRALTAMADEVQRLADENVVLLRDAIDTTRRTLAGITGVEE